MILWHLGVGCALVYVTLGRRRIDYRFVMLGAVLPDLIDAILSPFVEDGGSGRSIAHTLLSVIVVAVAILLGTRGETRLAVFGIAVGWLTHLVADGMWRAPETFLWPAFGTEFATTPAEPYSLDLFVHPLDHWEVWLGEVVGALILWWFWVAFEMGKRDRFKLFLSDGYLRP